MYLYIIIVAIIILYFIILKINKHMIYKPYIPFEDEYNNMIEKHNMENTENIMITNGDEKYINILWLNKNNENIVIYVHGNSGWIGSVIESTAIKSLLEHSSVAVFDYSGYGISDGNPSEGQTYKDLDLVIKYFVDIKKISPNNIIIYGFSLGTSIASKLVAENKEHKFKALILEAPFISIRDVAYEMNPLFKYLSITNYNNYNNLKKIKENDINIDITIIHSKSDEIINFSHGKKLSDEFKCPLLEIKGSHNEPLYENKLKEIFIKYK